VDCHMHAPSEVAKIEADAKGEAEERVGGISAVVEAEAARSSSDPSRWRCPTAPLPPSMLRFIACGAHHDRR